MGVAEICPYCGANPRALTGRFKRAASHAASARGESHPASMTYIFTVLIVGIYVATIVAGGQEEGRGGLDFMPPNTDFLFRLGLMSNWHVLHGEPWRLVTAIFLHLSLLHVLFTARAIWGLGRHYEADVGSPTMIATFILAGIGGFALCLALGSSGGGGASGAGTGIMGAIIVRRWRVDGHFRDPVTQYAVQFAIGTAIFGLAVARVNNIAHLGGFLVGGGIGWLSAYADRKAWGPRFWLASAGVSLALALASVSAVAFAGAATTPQDLLNAHKCVEAAYGAQSADGTTVSPVNAGSAIACLEALPKFEADAQAALDQLREGLRRAKRGRETGSMTAERTGLAELGAGARAWNMWLAANLERFGLELRPR